MNGFLRSIAPVVDGPLSAQFGLVLVGLADGPLLPLARRVSAAVAIGVRRVPVAGGFVEPRRSRKRTVATVMVTSGIEKKMKFRDWQTRARGDRSSFVDASSTCTPHNGRSRTAQIWTAIARVPLSGGSS